ncbi:E3 ubiquitin/ISG15 ligase TRIM25 [Lemmus lemmus]
MAQLVPLAEELSCSICLEPFKEPVTTPCGHNFCRSCLDETWVVQGPPYRCPQCRTVYQARPQLHKNTVLCAIVEQFLQADQARTPVDDWTPPARSATSSSATQVACDHCLKEFAVKTCLVCMASFCQEHLRPHFDSPAFLDHPLQSPVRDLLRRKCPQHNRLRELFCPAHGECICHICLVEHKTCSPTPLSQACADLENKLRHKLSIMHNHISGATRALEDVRAKQQSVHDSMSRKLEQLRQEYMEIKAVVDSAETSSTRKLKEEEKRVFGKLDTIYQVLVKKKNEMQDLKAEVELTLTKGDEFEFLEKATKLQEMSTKPVYIPKIDLDHELIKGVYQGTMDLKNELKRSLKQLQEKKAEESVGPGDIGGHGDTESTSKPTRPGKKIQQEKKAKKTPTGPTPSSPSPNKLTFGAPGQSTDFKTTIPDATPKANTPQPNLTALKAKMLDNFLAKSRAELLEYVVKVIFDYNTAHNKVALTDNYTTASVAEGLQHYRSHPQRFTYCSQVLGLHCYKKGIHYWEVELQKNNFCGVGICYGSMERQGPESRLGRNANSWCVEWFNNKISAWHNNVEKTLPSTKATRVGVLLNCDHGFVIFFAVTEKIYLMYKYKVDFTEALYPAFWVFSAGTKLSICSSK